MEPIDRRLAAGWAPRTTPSAATMVRSDGIASAASFLETPQGRMFTVRHEPSGPSAGTIVVCPPILAEAVRNQRRELVLGWELSAARFAATRFHYIGSGHSDGEPETMTFEGLVADGARVAAESAPDAGIGFVGTRLGALVATTVAAGFPGAPLVLWEPPLDMKRYYNEVFRARMIGLLRSGQRGPTSRELMDSFAAAGILDVVGNPLPYGLYTSTVDLDLGELLIAAGPRPVLIIQLSVKPQLRPGLAALVERCRGAGIDIATEVVGFDEAWWFGANGYTVLEVEAGGLDALPLTTGFFHEVLG